MNSLSLDPRIADPDIPLCFDTNAIFGKVFPARFVRTVRERFPRRPLLIPVIVVAESVRQLKVAYQDRFNVNMIRSFLRMPEYGLEVVAFDEEVTLDSWLAVTGRFSEVEWERERCRTGDHMIYALARSRNALLVTGDKPLRKQIAKDGVYPGAIETNELKKFLGLDP